MARKMKDSGIEWIGEIPENWELRKGKYVFTERNERGNSKELQLLSPTQKYGVVPQKLYEELSGMKAVKLEENVDYSTLKSIFSGDFCISLRSFQGGFEYSQYNGVVSPAYHVFYKTVPVCDAYFKFLFKDNSFIKKMASLTRTFRDGKSISFEDFSNSYIPVPPFEEQNRIAFFLEERWAYIDSIITKTRSSIDEYKKLKQAVITQAVTKGVRGDRPMKDSGIEWIGEIPETWKITKLKKVTSSIGDGLHSTPQFDDTGTVFFINGNNIGGEYLEIKEDTKRLSLEELSHYKLPELNSQTIMIALNGATYGKVSLFCDFPMLLGKSAGYITVDNSNSCEFVRYYLMSTPAKIIMALSLNGTTIQNLSLATLRDFSIPLPTFSEQMQIVSYLKEKCSAIDTLIVKKQAVLSELENYKKSMIYEYITGKREV